MSKPKDDLESVRLVAEALEGFGKEEQHRIIRWAMEKVGLSVSTQSGLPISAQSTSGTSIQAYNSSAATADIKAFIAEKNPQSDKQFATTVAYFYQFQAPPEQRKEEIGSDDLQEACRLSGRARLNSPAKTLDNSMRGGLLNKGSRGKFTLSTVGENLVAMSLPSSSQNIVKKKVSRRKK